MKAGFKTKKAALILALAAGVSGPAVLWSQANAVDSVEGLTGRSDKAPVVSVSSTAELVETQFGGSYVYPPANVLDGKGETTWAPGGRGIDQAISIGFADNINFDEIQIVNGFAGANDLYNKNNRIKTIQISHIAGKTHFQSSVFTLADNTPVWQSIKFPGTQLGKSVIFTIKDVYPGYKYDDTCLSDIRFLLNGKVIPYQNADVLLAAQTKTSKELLGKNSADDFVKKFQRVPLVADSGDSYYFDGDTVYNGKYDPKSNTFYVDEDFGEVSYEVNANRLKLTEQIGYVQSYQSLIFIPDGDKGIRLNGVYYKRIAVKGDPNFGYL